MLKRHMPLSSSSHGLVLVGDESKCDCLLLPLTLFLHHLSLGSLIFLYGVEGVVSAMAKC